MNLVDRAAATALAFHNGQVNKHDNMPYYASTLSAATEGVPVGW